MINVILTDSNHEYDNGLIATILVGYGSNGISGIASIYD